VTIDIDKNNNNARSEKNTPLLLEKLCFEIRLSFFLTATSYTWWDLMGDMWTVKFIENA
jgi:hypothetical protein